MAGSGGVRAAESSRPQVFRIVELGLERRAVDAVFRALPVIVLPGYRRPLVRVADYLGLLERSTYDGDRVR